MSPWATHCSLWKNNKTKKHRERKKTTLEKGHLAPEGGRAASLAPPSVNLPAGQVYPRQVSAGQASIVAAVHKCVGALRGAETSRTPIFGRPRSTVFLASIT